MRKSKTSTNYSLKVMFFMALWIMARSFGTFSAVFSQMPQCRMKTTMNMRNLMMKNLKLRKFSPAYICLNTLQTLKKNTQIFRGMSWFNPASS